MRMKTPFVVVSLSFAACLIATAARAATYSWPRGRRHRQRRQDLVRGRERCPTTGLHRRGQPQAGGLAGSARRAHGHRWPAPTAASCTSPAPQ